MKPPWLKMFRSGAVWAIIVAHVSFTWVYSWILAYLPMYMEEVLHYDIAAVNMLRRGREGGPRGRGEGGTPGGCRE